MRRKCVLNNMIMANQRKSIVYQTTIVDLYLVGKLSKEEAERLIGCDIPDYLKLPDVKEEVKKEEGSNGPGASDDADDGKPDTVSDDDTDDGKPAAVSDEDDE